jgi:hypothetical protein
MRDTIVGLALPARGALDRNAMTARGATLPPKRPVATCEATNRAFASHNFDGYRRRSLASGVALRPTQSGYGVL